MHRRSGISLIECLVYIAVLSVVVTLALAGFNRCWDDNKHLRQNADDIVHALHAGEQWRADLRAATGAIQVTSQGDEEKLVIPQPTGQIVYDYAHGKLLRKTGGTKPVLVLGHIKSSQMRADPRPHVTSWRWELELVPGQKNVRMLPLFTFEAATGKPLAP